VKAQKEEKDCQETLKTVIHYFYQDNTKAGSHCRYRMQYHIAWIHKYRHSFLVGEIAERLLQILKEIARDYRLHIIAMEVMPDHVHMLIEARPSTHPRKSFTTVSY
jgi:putative transposase